MVASVCLALVGCKRAAPEAQAKLEESDAKAAEPASVELTKADAKADAKSTASAELADAVAPQTHAGSGTDGGSSTGGAPVEEPLVEEPRREIPAAEMLVVTREDGVVVLDLEGKLVRKLSETRGRSPRWLPGRKRVAFLRTTKYRHSTHVMLIDLAAGTQRRVAKLPLEAPCPDKFYFDPSFPDEPDIPSMDLYNEDELWITDDGKHVCMLASDSSVNLRSNGQTVAVRLADGHVEHVLMYGGEECSAPTVEDGLEHCQKEYPEWNPEPSPAGGMIASRSPDGRWHLVLVASALADLLHLQYVLYDTRGRKSYPLVREGAAPWPSPVTYVVPEHDDEMIPGLPEVEESETVTWVGDHHLVVGQTLFIAGERIVPLGGDVAI